MKLVLIFGPHAVGKMTVGQELAKITDLKLFHNHMTIDLVSQFFPYSTEEGRRLINLFRQEIFKEVAKSDLDGLIFTYVWKLDQEVNCDYVQKICDIFESKGGEVCFVELEADVKERLKRNRHPHRLKHKPCKNNFDESEKILRDTMNENRLNSEKGEIKKENWIKIDNTNLSPEEVARSVKERFEL